MWGMWGMKHPVNFRNFFSHSLLHSFTPSLLHSFTPSLIENNTQTMNINSYKYLVLLALLGSIWGLKAQNNPLEGKDKLVLENERIEDVIDSDKPFLKIPYQEIKEGELSEISYQSQDLYVETDFEPAPPTPRPLQFDKEMPLYNNFVKAGFGRFATPELKLYLHGERDQYDYGVDFTHLSAHNDPVEFREFREDYGKIHIGYLTDQSKFLGQLKVYNTQYFNYADTMARPSREALVDSIRMAFTQVDLGGQVLHNYEADVPYDYDLGVNLQLYTGRRGNSEFHLRLSPNGSYEIGDGIEVGATSEFMYTAANIGEVSQSRIFLDFTPQLRYSTGAFALKAGLRLGYFNNNADSASQAAAVPQLDLRYNLIPRSLTVFAGITGRVINNRYYDLIRENRFLASDVNLRASVERANIYGGVSGQLGNKADYNARVSYRRVEDALVHVVPDSGAYFSLAYDSVMNVIGLDVEINYDILEELKAGVHLTYNNYNTSTLARNFHATPLQIGLYGEYTYQEKLTGTAELNFFGTTPMAQTADGEIINRGTFVDINLGVDFRLNERLSLWLAVNNLLGTNFQRWYNYDERPLDIKGGLTFAF
jgi:hypothetical protein